jgi:uncharacterized membrane protein YdjX (TVP38/TMEM64 family)
VYALSPGLREGLGGLAASAGLLGEAYAAGVKGFVLSFGAFSPAVFFFVMVAQVFLAPIPSAPVSLAGSLVFGVWEGFGLSLAGSVVGSVLAFLAVRRWGEPLVERLVGREVLGRYSGKVDGGGGGLWLFAFLAVPFTPDDAAVALAGLSGISFWSFFAVMVAGRVPGHATTALLASGWVTGPAAALITAGIALTAVLALAFAYRRRLRSWIRPAADGQAGAEPGAALSEEGVR